MEPHARRAPPRASDGARLAVLLATLLAARHAAQAPADDALARYHELGPAARAGTLGPEGALELGAAVRVLLSERTLELDPLELHQTALAAADASGDAPFVLQILRGTASLLRNRGERGALCELLLARLPGLAERAPGDADLVLLEFLLVQVLREENRWPAALEWIETALAHLVDSPYRASVESMLHGERAAVYLAWGLPDLARRWHARQRAALGELGGNALRHADLIEANLRLAEMDDAYRAREVEQFLAERLADAELYPPGAPRGRLLVRLALARLERARREPAALGAAREALEQALALAALEPYERQRAELTLAEVATRAGEAEAARAALVRARNGAGALPPDLRAIAACTRVQLARLSDEPAEREEARSELERAALAFLADWARLPTREGGFGFLLFREHRRVFGELVATTLETGGADAAERALAPVLAAQALSSLARTLAGSEGAPVTPSLAELRAELCPPGHGVLLWLPGPEQSHLFVLDHESLACLALGPMDELRSAAERALAAWLRREPQEARAAAASEAAERLLPEPARARVATWTHATLVGTEFLPPLPYEALPLDAGLTLGERCALTHAGSLVAQLALARRARARPPASDEVWLLANPEPPASAARFAAELVALPFDAEDAARWLAPYASAKREFIGPGATRAALTDPALARARLLQVVAHGGRDVEDERPALLLLAPETSASDDAGEVRARDVERGVAPELVLLIACSAGQGPAREGDAGAADLGGAFLRAGAGCVLLSPLPLEFHATTHLLAAFHEALAEGAAPSEALQRARLSLAADPRLSGDPAAALVRLEGLGHRAVFAARDPTRAGGILTLVLGAGATVVVALLAARARALRGSAASDPS